MCAMWKPLLLSLCAASLMAGEPPARPESQMRPEIKLKNERWQALPCQVTKVYVGARRARVAFLPNGPGTLRSRKEIIPRVDQAGNRTGVPQPHAANLGSGTGFVRARRPRLVQAASYRQPDAARLRRQGVDRTFDSRPRRRDHRALHHERALLKGRENRYAGGVAWFLTRRGVLRYENKRWSHQKIVDGPVNPMPFDHEMPSEALWMAVSPDGKGAVAYSSRARSLWHFRGGKWSMLDKTPAEAENMGGQNMGGRGFRQNRHMPHMSPIIGLVMPNAQTAWRLNSSELLQRVPLAGAEDEAAMAACLVEDLKSDRVRMREKATKQLMAMPWSIQPVLQKALDKSEDEEQKTRLEFILKNMRAQGRQATFGSLQVSDCRQMWEDGRGRVFVIAMKISGRDGGMAVMGRDGKASKVSDLEYASDPDHRVTEPGHSPFAEDWPPILTPSGDQLWFADPAKSEPAKLLDLNSGDFIDTLPHPTCGWIQAISSDGRMFVSAGSWRVYMDTSRYPMLPPDVAKVVMVYSPKAPTEKPLPMSKIEVLPSSEIAGVTEDGAVWTQTADGLVRFDGRNWKTMRDAAR